MSAEDGYEDFHDNSSDDGSKGKNFINANRVSMIFAMLGLICVGLGVFFYKDSMLDDSNDIEIIDVAESESSTSTIIVEISGSVEQPGVYEMENGSRVNDLIVLAGGLQDNADREFLDKIINRAAKLTDGQKLYIPHLNEQSTPDSANSLTGGAGNIQGVEQNILGVVDTQTKRVNVNAATQSELENLWGIGPVTAQNIIEQRPYSTVEKLLTKKILKSNVLERNKNLLSVY